MFALILEVLGLFILLGVLVAVSPILACAVLGIFLVLMGMALDRRKSGKEGK